MQIKMKMAGEEKRPKTKDMWQRYVRAERLLPRNAQKLCSDLTIKPRWMDNADCFVYRWKSLAGLEYALVDAATRERKAAFNHERLAAALSQATGLPLHPAQLPLSRIEFADDSVAFDLDVEWQGGRWVCDLSTYDCMRIGDVTDPPSEVLCSPDGQWEAFSREHNVWIRSVASGEERAITTNGEDKHDYGQLLLSPLTTAGIEDPPPPAIIWSPDSCKLFFCRVDQRDAPQFHLVQSVPTDGSLRPRLHSFAYPLPGDEVLPLASLFCADLNAGTLTAIDIEPKEVQYHGPPLHDDSVWWSADSRNIYFLRQGRGYFEMDLVRIDATTGASRVLISERSDTGIDPSIWRGQSCVRVFADGARVLWYSQRDGWGHLYLYDAEDGSLLRQLTAGAYEVSDVQHIDEEARLLYFTATGRETGRDPYFRHLYRLSLDGGPAELLTPEDADHEIIFAPSGRYFIDNYSTVEDAPDIVLRAADGAWRCEIEQADISALEATGWRRPERFVAKARDGRADLYGTIFRPSDLDADAQYPVIDYIYGGPQAVQAPASFADAARGREHNFWHAQALAELGFVVIMMDGLGMPGRSKALHDHSYGNLADNGLPDHISAIRQLADRFDYLDISRVGIFGHSAGGYASCRAMFDYPDFFKVAVSSAGNHDHRLDKATWVERYMGLPVGEHYAFSANQNHAHRLEGKLLLIHGDMDENVHVASTLIVVDALIKANKDFDLLIMPNQPHACTDHPYFLRRRWDYFTRHLLGLQPPAGYQIQ